MPTKLDTTVLTDTITTFGCQSVSPTHKTDTKGL